METERRPDEVSPGAPEEPRRDVEPNHGDGPLPNQSPDPERDREERGGDAPVEEG